MQQKACQVHVEGPAQRMQSVANCPQKQTVDPAVSNSATLVSAVTVYPIQTDYKEERWQHTPLREFNTNGERLWFNFAYMNTNIWTGIKWLDGQKQATVNNILLQHSPKLFTKYDPVVYFLEVDETSVNIWYTTPNIVENLLEVRIWSVVLRRPVTSLGHQVGRRVFYWGPNFLNYVQYIFLGGAKKI